MLTDPPQKKKIVEKREKREKQRKKDEESFRKQTTKCKYCGAYFCTSKDYKYHVDTHWKKTKKGEILNSELDMDLTRRLRLVGRMIEGEYRYTLLGNGEVIYREKLG